MRSHLRATTFRPSDHQTDRNGSKISSRAIICCVPADGYSATVGLQVDGCSIDGGRAGALLCCGSSRPGRMRVVRWRRASLTSGDGQRRKVHLAGSLACAVVVLAECRSRLDFIHSLTSPSRSVCPEQTGRQKSVSLLVFEDPLMTAASKRLLFAARRSPIVLTNTHAKYKPASGCCSGNEISQIRSKTDDKLMRRAADPNR